jgi:hypothetical protein
MPIRWQLVTTTIAGYGLRVVTNAMYFGDSPKFRLVSWVQSVTARETALPIITQQYNVLYSSHFHNHQLFWAGSKYAIFRVVCCTFTDIPPSLKVLMNIRYQVFMTLNIVNVYNVFNFLYSGFVCSMYFARFELLLLYLKSRLCSVCVFVCVHILLR